MHKVGVHDFLPMLTMANSKQWEYILDVEVWEEDRMDLNLMTQVFALLFKADPQRLLRWTITEKPAFIEFFLFHNIQIVVREHDEVPPEDFDDYTTLDDKFYFRFPNRKPDQPEQQPDELLPGDIPKENTLHEEAPDLIENMLKTLAEMDLSVFHGLLLETSALLPAEAEEEEFRLKNLRLAEKGFLPAHEAIGIYQPSPALRKRPGLPENEFHPDQPLPPQFFTQFIQGDQLFVKAVNLLKNRGASLLEINNELAALINKIISADRVKIRQQNDVQEVMTKAAAYLSLGIETILDRDITLDHAADTINQYFLEDIFRAGARAGSQLRAQAKTWYDKSFIKENNLPLSFLGESFLGVVGGLLIERPMFFANYENKELYRHFQSLKDIRATQRLLEEIFSLDSFLKVITPNISSFTQGVLTFKSMILTLWARNRTGLNPATILGEESGTFEGLSLAPIPLDDFRAFFTDLFTGEEPEKIDDPKARDLGLWAARAMDRPDLPLPLQTLLLSLINELEEEYGSVDPEQIDPRFMPHFFIQYSQDPHMGDDE
jgi:hypothetical protein